MIDIIFYYNKYVFMYIQYVYANTHRFSVALVKKFIFMQKRCQAISNTESVNSDLSSAKIVTSIGGAATSYAGTLRVAINYPDSKILPGNRVTLSCQGVPMGYSGAVSFVDGSDNVLISSNPSSVSAQLVMAADKSGRSIACTLATTNQVTFSKSTNSVVLPTTAAPNPITAVTIRARDSSSDILTTPTYNVGADGPILICTTTPVPEFLDGTKPITYNFQAGTTSKQNNASNTYKVDTSAEGSTTYKCVATHDGVTFEAVLGYAIVVNAAFVTAPVVTMVKPTTALSIGSTLVLSCGTLKVTSVTYSWLVSDKIIDGQTDWTIQLYNFSDTDIGVYKCRVTKDRYTVDSSFQTNIKPTVTRVTSGNVYGQGGDYVLKCNTGSSATAGWTYLWKKGTADTSIKTQNYTITNAAAATHDGTYSCTSTYNGLSGTSDQLTVAVVAPGKRCTADTECTGTGFSGKCSTTNPKVCECSSNYILKGETCASGATALISCVLMVVVASLGSSFF